MFMFFQLFSFKSDIPNRQETNLLKRLGDRERATKLSRLSSLISMKAHQLLFDTLSTAKRAQQMGGFDK